MTETKRKANGKQTERPSVKLVSTDILNAFIAVPSCELRTPQTNDSVPIYMFEV